MNKTLKTFSSIVCLSLMFAVLFSGIVHGNPDTYYAHPTNHANNVGGGGLVVTSPTKAYDNSNVTYAITSYARGGTGAAAGNFELIAFDGGRPLGSSISQVNLTIGYKTTISSGDATYEISYFVNPSATKATLKGPTRDTITENRTWTISDPNNAAWDWKDVSNVRVRFTTADGGSADSGGLLYIYEAWLTVAYTPVRVFVNPQARHYQSETAPFTVDVNVTNVNELYGWEFKLYYNTTILTATGVTQGSFFTGAGKSTYFNVISINDAQGFVWATCSVTGDVAGVTGDGTLATVTFSPDGPRGKTTLDLQDVKLAGYDFTAKSIYAMGIMTFDGEVTRLLGDINRDGWVSSGDLSLLSQSYGGLSVPNADLNTSGRVDVTDLNLLAKDWQPAP